MTQHLTSNTGWSSGDWRRHRRSSPGRWSCSGDWKRAARVAAHPCVLGSDSCEWPCSRCWPLFFEYFHYHFWEAGTALCSRRTKHRQMNNRDEAGSMGQDQKLGEFKSMIWANEPQQTIKQVDITGGLYIGKMRETFNRLLPGTRWEMKTWTMNLVTPVDIKKWKRKK